MKTLHPFRASWLARLVLALTYVAYCSGAQAQFRLPSVTLPSTNMAEQLGGELLRAPGPRLNRLRELPDTGGLRLAQIKDLLRQHRDVLEADPRGDPVVRREILAWTPTQGGLAIAAAAGVTVLRESRLNGLDDVVVVLQVPLALDTAVPLDPLRKLDPEGTYDFNHVYIGSGGVSAFNGATSPIRPRHSTAPMTSTNCAEDWSTAGSTSATPRFTAPRSNAGVALTPCIQTCRALRWLH